ncbi:MAG: hypothetical protein HDQ88_03000 [Clostridia bacterium]|nr:hypothetical protein [Clostridia bacterium]
MKTDYQKTIDGLKEEGLIQDGDKYAVALFKTESQSNGVTSTMITSTVDYIMVANDDAIKLFEIDKKTGEYLGNFISLEKESIVYTKRISGRNFIWASKGLFGGKYIGVHFIAFDFVHDYLLPKKYRGYEQKEASNALYTFVKETYNTHYDKLEKIGKGKI